MDKEREVAKLQALYPGSKIICVPEENPTEIICEFEPKNGFDQSRAIAVIERSAPHFHHEMTEVYIVEEGSLTLHYDGLTATLKAGDAVVIPPGHVHWAEGVENPAVVRVIASPAWSAEDHILFPEQIAGSDEERRGLIDSMLSELYPLPDDAAEDEAEAIAAERHVHLMKAGWNWRPIDELRKLAAK